MNEKEKKARKNSKGISGLMRGHQAESFLQTWDRGGVDLKGNLTVAQIPKIRAVIGHSVALSHTPCP